MLVYNYNIKNNEGCSKKLSFLFLECAIQMKTTHSILQYMCCVVTMKHVAGSQNTNIYTNLSSLNPRWDVRKSQVVDSCQNKEITLYKYTLDRNLLTLNFESSL